MSEPLLSINDLKAYYFTTEGVVKAVDGVTLKINEGEAVAVDQVTLSTAGACTIYGYFIDN